MLLVMLLKVFGGPEKFIIILEAGEEDQETFFKNFMRMLEVIVAYYKLHKKSKGGE